MRFKKILMFILIVLALFRFSVSSYASNIDEYNRNWLEESGASGLEDYIDEETEEYLEKLGCDISDFGSILAVSLDSVVNLILEILRSGWSEPFKGLLTAVSTVILYGIGSSFTAGNSKSEAAVALVCSAGLITGIFSIAANSIRAGASVVKTAAAFEKALIPVLAVLLTASGNPTAAISVQGAAFAGAQAVEMIAAETAMPLSVMSGLLGMLGAVLPSMKLSVVSDLIRKVMTVTLSACAGLFSGFLAIKSVLASAADSMGFRGIRFAANTLVPVVGGAISEAFASVSAAAGLIKNTVAVYAVAVFCFMCIPVIINFSLWILSMKIAGCIAQLIGASQCGEIINHTGFIFSMMNAVVLLSAAVFIISAGLVVAINSGA
ncbi:MAG: hypothetical protein J6A60_02545 [Clostridia bacterium]|nr:hypothetical protein [Clostridia bacterium]